MEEHLTKNEKISKKMAGRTLSKEHRKRISMAKTGTRQSLTTKGKIKRAMTKKQSLQVPSSHPLVPKSTMSRSHLTAEDVKTIRDRYSNETNTSIRSLAEEFKVSRHTIHSIVHYKIWK